MRQSCSALEALAEAQRRTEDAILKLMAGLVALRIEVSRPMEEMKNFLWFGRKLLFLW